MALTIVEEARPVTGGVDTHADTHVAAALDPVGGLPGVEEFPATAAGYARLLGWLGGFGTVCLVGIEGTGSYGAGLARHITAAGVRVVEVDRPDRQDRRRQGKSDPLDAVSAVPPKTAISRNFGSPVFRLVRRQAQALPDLLLDDLRRGPRVHGVDVLLAPEDLQDGVRLVVIVPQPDRERLLGVIFAGDQLSAAHVAPAGDLRAVGDQVVIQPAAAAQPAVQNPAADLAVRQVKLDDAVDVVALQEELGLPRVPREPVDDEAEVPVVLGEPVPDHRLHQVVPDQFPGRHGAPDLGAQLGVVLHVPPEDIPHADVH